MKYFNFTPKKNLNSSLFYSACKIDNTKINCNFISAFFWVCSYFFVLRLKFNKIQFLRYSMSEMHCKCSHYSQIHKSSLFLTGHPVYFRVIRFYCSRPTICCNKHLVYFMVVWICLSRPTLSISYNLKFGVCLLYKF